MGSQGETVENGPDLDLEGMAGGANHNRLGYLGGHREGVPVLRIASYHRPAEHKLTRPGARAKWNREPGLTGSCFPTLPHGLERGLKVGKGYSTARE